MNTSNNRSFSANIATIKRSGATIAAAVQNAIIQACAHYTQHGDTVYFTRLMDAAKESRTIRTATLLGFIKEHANVKYVNSKDKNNKKPLKAGTESQTERLRNELTEFLGEAA